MVFVGTDCVVRMGIVMAVEDLSCIVFASLIFSCAASFPHFMFSVLLYTLWTFNLLRSVLLWDRDNCTVIGVESEREREEGRKREKKVEKISQSSIYSRD
jgi:hypothetical protein